MLVRKYLNSDFQAIADIYNQAIVKGGITFDNRCFTSEDIESIVAKFNERQTMLVATQDNLVVGWGIIKQYSDRPGYDVCCETSIYLSFDHIGKGYGSILQTALLEKVAEFGYHHVVAKIVASNQGSIQFHQRFGFEMVGIQKEIGFMGGVWYDVAIMQLIMPYSTS